MVTDAVIDVGGFLGIGEKPVAIDVNSLEITRDENGTLMIMTSFTEEQLNNQTAYDEEAYRNDPDAVVIR